MERFSSSGLGPQTTNGAYKASGWVLGIDLGTTNTAAVALARGSSEPVSILHGRDQLVMPSVVSLKNPNLPLVGWLAKDMLLTDPTTTLIGWKRFIGRTERSEYVQRYRHRFPFQIRADAHGALGASVGNQVFSFEHIAALVLDQVRLQATAALSEDVRDTVISVPAHFSAAQRYAVLEAGRRARLNVLRLVNEPTAAALAFGIGQRLDAKLLVFDLGGGTFDATLLELVDNIFDVRVTRGEGFLGGADFDRAIMNRCLSVIQRKHHADLSNEPVVAQRILNAAEVAKIRLSDHEQARIHVPTVGTDRKGNWFDLDYTLSRKELEALTAPLIERAIGIVEDMIQGRHVDHILAVGGQSRMPLVLKRIAETLGKAPLTHLNPDTCVAYGAALVGQGEGRFDGAVLLDVLSVPIGILFPGGQTDFVFDAGCNLPARTRIPVPRPLTTRDLAIGVWQGSSLTSSERHVLGVLEIGSHLFEGGGPCSLELSLTEDLRVSANFINENRCESIPLAQAPYRS
ncbi:MAG: Hsp70 family protein [Myxococcales bacterium]|nr:Hsp70 family protein [Myxococcales bacterium]